MSAFLNLKSHAFNLKLKKKLLLKTVPNELNVASYKLKKSFKNYRASSENLKNLSLKIHKISFSLNLLRLAIIIIVVLCPRKALQNYGLFSIMYALILFKKKYKNTIYNDMQFVARHF